MASNYPGAFDSFPTITADKLLSDAVGGRAHRAMHNDMGDVIEAMQAELGLNPSGQAATVADRLANQAMYNVKDYGAVGDGSTDDSAAIRSALTAGTGAIVYFPDGTYKVSKYGANSYCLSVPAETTLTGPGTVKLAASSDEWVQVFHVGAVDGVTFDGITIDGNKGNNTTHEHRHGIMVTDVTGFAARNCRIVDCTGDGIMLDTSTQCQITGNHISGCERNAVTLYADVVSTSTSHVRIVDNYLECASQPVDSEPENGATTDDIQVIGNTLISTNNDYALAVMGSRWTVTGNQMTGGVYIITADQIRLTDNHIDGTVTTFNDAAVLIHSAATNITVAGNRVTTTLTGQLGISAAYNTIESTKITIRDNDVITNDNHAIEVRTSSTIVQGNRCTLTDANTAWICGIRVYATHDIADIAIVGNEINDFEIGVEVNVYDTFDVARALVTNNVITTSGSPRAGLRLLGGTQNPMCVVADNVITGYGSDAYVQSTPETVRQAFFDATPILKPDVTGSRGSNAALASLLTALADLGLIVNSTS